MVYSYKIAQIGEKGNHAGGDGRYGEKSNRSGSGADLGRALIRECWEELAITISVGSVFMEADHDYPDLNVHLTLFNAAISKGTPQMLEHNDIRWITVDEIPQYEFCPADETILRRLKCRN